MGDGLFLAVGTQVPKLVSLLRLLASADLVSIGRDGDDLVAVKELLDAGPDPLVGPENLCAKRRRAAPDRKVPARR